MCGIAGILTTRTDQDLPEILDRMRGRRLRHRGPDDEGSAELTLPGGFRLGLAHTRLAIIDLSPAGHQPMTDPESGSWITYNGEIYNHQAVRKRLSTQAYRSASDTETILKGWTECGERIVDQLRGMFAFALYDGHRHRFWLVRDRLGVKPLYVSRVASDSWIFASELRVLLASGLVAPRLNRQAVDSYLAFGAVTAPWTILDNVESLLPGETWHFDLSRSDRPLSPRKTRYWQPTFQPRHSPELTREEALERLRPVLLEAASLRMVADVPVGVFLSGGIDSSSVVAALSHQGHRLHTFSVVFGERQYDESDYSRTVARHFATEHTELLLPPERVLQNFDEALTAYDEPSIDGVNTYFISEATRQAGVKVALSGIGGDELFAGYSYFRWLARLDSALPRRLAGVVHGGLRLLAPRSTRTTKLGALLRGDRTPLTNYAICRQVIGGPRRQLLVGQAQATSAETLPLDLACSLREETKDLDPINAQSRLELALYLPNMLLRDTDQMSMAHALEVREPLLDHVLVETVAELAGGLKLRSGRGSPTKGLLVDALPEKLPLPVAQRKKMGFVFPWENWLRGPLCRNIAGRLTDASTLEQAGLNPNGVGQLWDDFRKCKPGIRYTDILALTHLAGWFDRTAKSARSAT